MLCTSAILSTSWVLELLVKWSQQPGVANMAPACEGSLRCGTQKALTVFIRRVWPMIVFLKSCCRCHEPRGVRTGTDSQPFQNASRTKVCKVAAGVKELDKHLASGIMSEYILCVMGGVGAFLAGHREGGGR